ncbi:hypothetical protein EJ05DRAFT_505368 [Pseudovirgaria hyperparasitica]|uniref:Uncharacterized protein n=1 Tax=Pseudovirgaria hyperparasitica TaxID=470096 RepID=A0A6A6VTG9_9PEZI|nr:uncharacterized protein EJ05DRAFT_505368 [Pseudovirgaria hyperparasitica]KAF2753179.1 hypothetical protein EJ05DRAFT_505368 [Pseudovirgaria hyperparasitica]
MLHSSPRTFYHGSRQTFDNLNTWIKDTKRIGYGIQTHEPFIQDWPTMPPNEATGLLNLLQQEINKRLPIAENDTAPVNFALSQQNGAPAPLRLSDPKMPTVTTALSPTSNSDTQSMFQAAEAQPGADEHGRIDARASPSSPTSVYSVPFLLCADSGTESGPTCHEHREETTKVSRHVSFTDLNINKCMPPSTTSMTEDNEEHLTDKAILPPPQSSEPRLSNHPLQPVLVSIRNDAKNSPLDKRRLNHKTLRRSNYFWHHHARVIELLEERAEIKTKSKPMSAYTVLNLAWTIFITAAMTTKKPPATDVRRLQAEMSRSYMYCMWMANMDGTVDTDARLDVSTFWYAVGEPLSSRFRLDLGLGSLEVSMPGTSSAKPGSRDDLTIAHSHILHILNLIQREFTNFDDRFSHRRGSHMFWVLSIWYSMHDLQKFKLDGWKHEPLLSTQAVRTPSIEDADAEQKIVKQTSRVLSGGIFDEFKDSSTYSVGLNGFKRGKTKGRRSNVPSITISHPETNPPSNSYLSTIPDTLLSPQSSRRSPRSKTGAAPRKSGGRYRLAKQKPLPPLPKKAPEDGKSGNSHKQSKITPRSSWALKIWALKSPRSSRSVKEIDRNNGSSFMILD